MSVTAVGPITKDHLETLAFRKYWIKQNAKAILASPGLQPTEEEFLDWIDKLIKGEIKL